MFWFHYSVAAPRNSSCPLYNYALPLCCPVINFDACIFTRGRKIPPSSSLTLRPSYFTYYYYVGTYSLLLLSFFSLYVFPFLSSFSPFPTTLALCIFRSWNNHGIITPRPRRNPPRRRRRRRRRRVARDLC